MAAIILVVHMMLATALVGVVLIQRSEGGALGGLGGGNFGGLMTGRGTANLLTRTTGILAACFITTSMILAILAGNSSRPPSILDLPASSGPSVPAPGGGISPATPMPPAQAPTQPGPPSAPLAQ